MPILRKVSRIASGPPREKTCTPAGCAAYATASPIFCSQLFQRDFAGHLHRDGSNPPPAFALHVGGPCAWETGVTCPGSAGRPERFRRIIRRISCVHTRRSPSNTPPRPHSLDSGPSRGCPPDGRPDSLAYGKALPPRGSRLLLSPHDAPTDGVGDAEFGMVSGTGRP